jgi:hypothetical protein
VEEHRRRALEILAVATPLGPLTYGTRTEREEARRRLAALEPAALASLLVMGAVEGWTFGVWFQDLAELLPPAGLPLEAADVALAVESAQRPGAEPGVVPLGLWSDLPRVVDVIEAYCVGGSSETIEGLLRAALAEIEAQLELWSPERTELRSRVRRLLPSRDTVDTTVFDEYDAWGVAACRIAGALSGSGELDRFLRHLDAPQLAKPRPTLAWTERAHELATAADATPLVRQLLEQALTSEVRIVPERVGDVPLYLTGPNAILVRSLLWVAAGDVDPWWLELAGPLIQRADAQAYGGPAPSARVARAGVEMLRDAEPTAARALLESLRDDLTHPQVIVDVDQMLAKLAGRSARKVGRRLQSAGTMVFKVEDEMNGVEIGSLHLVPAAGTDAVEVEDRWYTRDEAEQLAARVGYAFALA